jgi:hypothetical protein
MSIKALMLCALGLLFSPVEARAVSEGSSAATIPQADGTRVSVKVLAKKKKRRKKKKRKPSKEKTTIPTFKLDGFSSLVPGGQADHMWGNPGSHACSGCTEAPASVRASSALKGYPASNISEPNYGASIAQASRSLERAWCEGVEGSGVGQWVEMRFEHPVHFGAMHISPGYAKSRKSLLDNNQVRRLGVYLDGKKRAKLSFSRMTRAHDYTQLDWWRLKGGEKAAFERLDRRTFTTIRFVIEAVYRGAKDNDACMSSIELNFVPAD